MLSSRLLDEEWELQGMDPLTPEGKGSYSWRGSYFCPKRATVCPQTAKIPQSIISECTFRALPWPLLHTTLKNKWLSPKQWLPLSPCGDRASSQQELSTQSHFECIGWVTGACQRISLREIVAVPLLLVGWEGGPNTGKPELADFH